MSLSNYVGVYAQIKVIMSGQDLAKIWEKVNMRPPTPFE